VLLLYFFDRMPARRYICSSMNDGKGFPLFIQDRLIYKVKISRFNNTIYRHVCGIFFRLIRLPFYPYILQYIGKPLFRKFWKDLAKTPSNDVLPSAPNFKHTAVDKGKPQVWSIIDSCGTLGSFQDF